MVEHWQTALALGRVELELGKHRAAAEHLWFAEQATALPEPLRPEVERMLARAARNLGTLRLFVTATQQSRVYVDEELVGSTPLSVQLFRSAGDHLVQVQRAPHHNTRTVTLKLGETQEISVHLHVREPPPPSGPQLPRSLASPHETAEPLPAADSSSKLLPVLGLGGLALAAAALGTGLAFASYRKGGEADAGLMDLRFKHGDDTNHCRSDEHDPLCERIRDALIAQDSLFTSAIVAWIGVGITAAGAVTLGLLPSSEKPNVSLRPSPIAGPNVGGLLLLGSF
ncbi:MAG: PEGA domain-containing protein [Polyangiaceae bacterium]